MRKTRCPVCFLRQVIGRAADGLDEQQTRMLLSVLKRYAGLDYEMR